MDLQLAIQKLKDKGLKTTKARTGILSFLCQEMETLLTAQEIHENISSQDLCHCDLASVYRSLASFEEIGLVSRSDFLGEPSQYRMNLGESGHLHFFKCTKCGLVEPLSSCVLDSQEKTLENQGYRNLIHRLEFSGLCPSCVGLSH